MEKISRQNTINQLQEFLNKKEVNSTAMSFEQFFTTLRYFWEANEIQNKPKRIKEFLDTSILNARLRRDALKFNQETGIGIKGVSTIEVGSDIPMPDAFYLEVYAWKAKPDNPPEPLVPKLVTLTGLPANNDEKTIAYLSRLNAEGKIKYTKKTIEDNESIDFEIPFDGIPDLEVSGYMRSKRFGEIWGLQEIAIDIKIPYPAIEEWLSS